MPNLDPPVVTTEQAEIYYRQILKLIPIWVIPIQSFQSTIRFNYYLKTKVLLLLTIILYSKCALTAL